MNRDEAKEKLNAKFTQKKLIPFAQEQLGLKDIARIRTKRAQIEFILDNVSLSQLSKVLNPHPIRSYWERNSNNIYGLSSVIGLILAIAFFFWPSSVTGDLSIMGRVLNSSNSVAGAIVSLPQTTAQSVVTNKDGVFNFALINENRLPPDSIKIEVDFNGKKTSSYLYHNQKDYFDNIIIDLLGESNLLFSEDKFSVLILPFQLLQDCSIKNTGIEEALRSRFNDLIAEENINLEVSTLLSGNSCPDTYEEAKAIGLLYKANLVVWGDLYESCHSDSINSCLRYVIIDTPIKQISKEGKTITKQHTLQTISKGELQYDIDYIIYYSLALEASNRGDYESSIKYCLKIIEEIDSNSPSTFVTLGYSYSKIKDTLNAEASFYKSIELDSTKGGAYLNLAELYSRQEKFNKSKFFYLKGIHFEPENSQIHGNYAVLLYKQFKEYEKALLEFNEALTLDSTNITAYVGLGNLYLKRDNDFKTARSYYSKALSIDPYFDKAFMIRHNIGFSYFRESKLDTAEFHLRNNLKINPDFAASYFTLGQVYMKKKLVDTAQSLYRSSYKLEPSYNSPRFDSLFEIYPLKKDTFNNN